MSHQGLHTLQVKGEPLRCPKGEAKAGQTTAARGSAKTHLTRDSRPHLERVVVGAAHDTVPTELETRNDVVIVALQDLSKTRST